MNAEAILKEMTLEEKAAFCSGLDFWHTKAIERLSVPSVMMCDGPHGLRKQEGEGDHLGINKSIETVCYSTAAALASSFDRNVMAQGKPVFLRIAAGCEIMKLQLCRHEPGEQGDHRNLTGYRRGEYADKKGSNWFSRLTEKRTITYSIVV